MVSWWADGSVSGFVPDNNAPEEALPELGMSVYKLAVNGSVDAQGITRLQYPVPGANFRETIDAYARLNYSAADINAIFATSDSPTAAMFVADAANFPDGKVPTPSEILALGASKLQVVRATTFLNSTAQAGNSTFYMTGAYTQPGRKYWVLVLPVRSSTAFQGTQATFATEKPYGDPNVYGRAISMWSNRRPDAPVITSPSPDSIFTAGGSFTLSFIGTDPDAISGGGSYVYTDIAGVQIQYAPVPTLDNPTPTWIDLPIGTTNTSGTVAAGSGWWIDRTTQSIPASAGSSGAYLFWAQQTMPVKCSGTPSVPGAAILPSGKWQIRLRTFDYGHAFPRFARPLAAPNGGYNPNSFPETNTSPWSTPIKVTVAAQVPPAVLVSPVNNVALPVSKPVTLTWQYRNTFMPPYAQARREVFIREAGVANWTLLTDTFNALTSYTVEVNPSSPPSAPYEYMPNGGFENLPAGSHTDGTASSGSVPDLDGWTVATGQLYVVTNSTQDPNAAHSGSQALNAVMIDNGILQPVKRVALRAQDAVFDLSCWTRLGPNSLKQRLIFLWLNSAGSPIGGQQNFERPSGSGYQQTRAVGLIKPAGAVTMLVGIQTYDVGTAANNNGDLFDDVSLIGYTPGSTGYSFTAGKQYEWRVRTADTSGAVSDYSSTARFYVVPDPATGVLKPLPTASIDAATLGCGKHTVEVFRRGGQIKVGVLDSISYVDWGRLRDDISDAKVIISGWGADCGALLARLQTWAYEIVIWRDNGYGKERVWEGPITLLTYETDKVTIQAKDVMAYAYRRIVKQAMNDSGNGDTVTSRAARILQNVLAPEDPNLLGYLQVLSDTNDAKQYRNLPAFTRTAYEEIDDMAANSGLDYCAVGRAILLWSTKHRIGTLPEFRDEHFGSPPIVSEYGMQAANVYSVADGNGVHGEANRLDVSGNDPIYGLIEMLSSTWATDSPEDTGTYTQAGLATTVKSFEDSAERSIADRYPPPVVVRVPDNTSLSADTPISIQNLVPGVVIPLRSTSTLRPVADNQKLDSIKVTETDKGETIVVVMSPFTREDNSADTEGV